MSISIGIVGLGLIGGSMAKAVRASILAGRQTFADKIYANDLSREVLGRAISEEVIDGELDANLSDCDLIMIAIPPKACIGWIEANAPKLTGKILIDLCGVKKSIHDVAQPLSQKYGFTYIGGHPMAGKEVAGYESSDANLYKNAPMILTPDEGTDHGLINTVSEFFLSIGFGRITITTIETHDEIIAYTSQLAHVASSAYIKSPTAQLQAGFSAGSYRDLTRVAKLDENMWTELFMYNRQPLIKEVKLLIDNLSDYLEVLESGDADKLRELLKRGRELKESAGGR